MRYDLIRILLVDDNQHMRVLLVEILRAIGVVHIYEASDGAEALQKLRNHQVDIVMTDLSMQPLDGIDFVRLLRNSPDSPNAVKKPLKKPKKRLSKPILAAFIYTV